MLNLCCATEIRSVLYHQSDIFVKRSTYVFFHTFFVHGAEAQCAHCIQYNALNLQFTMLNIRRSDRLHFCCCCCFFCLVLSRLDLPSINLYVFAFSRKSHTQWFYDEFSCSVSLLMNMNANNQKRKHSNRLLLSKVATILFHIVELDPKNYADFVVDAGDFICVQFFLYFILLLCFFLLFSSIYSWLMLHCFVKCVSSLALNSKYQI